MELNNNYNILSREDLREWIIFNGVDNNLLEKNKLWVFLFQQKKFDALDEWLETPWDINGRDEQGKGWVQWCIEAKAPSWLLLKSWPRLDASWWAPDQDGNTPFHVCDNQVVLHILWTRWWADRSDWRWLSTKKGPPEKTNLAILQYWPIHLLGNLPNKSVDNPRV